MGWFSKPKPKRISVQSATSKAERLLIEMQIEMARYDREADQQQRHTG